MIKKSSPQRLLILHFHRCYSSRMNTIDYIYRFDPTNPSAKPLPNDAESARRTLEDGNRTFARWMESCRKASPTEGEPRYVVPCNAQEVGMIRGSGEMPKQSPFGVVVGG